MARIRSIKPELRTSITVSLWPREVRYFFILLWGYLDDYGRGVDDELLIASDCFPRDRDVTPEQVDGWLELIADSGPLCRYEVDGRRYLHAPNWREHQKPSHPTRSKIPPCPDDDPEWFKAWRETHPQRLTKRSRKSREELQKIPDGSPKGAESLSGRASGEVSQGHGHGEDVAQDGTELPAPEDPDIPGQGGAEVTPEDFANPSGEAPEGFVPEQGSKGAREQGEKREPRAPKGEPSSTAVAKSERPDGRPPLQELPEDFALTEAMRRWAEATYPRVDPDHETQKFIWHWQDEGKRRRNWYGEWQKWIANANQYLIKNGPSTTPSNVVALPSSQPLPGTDTRVHGWLSLPTEGEVS